MKESGFSRHHRRHTKDATTSKRMLARRKVSKWTRRVEPTAYMLRNYPHESTRSEPSSIDVFDVLRRSQPIDEDSRAMHVAPVTSSHTWRRPFGPPLLQRTLSEAFESSFCRCHVDEQPLPAHTSTHAHHMTHRCFSLQYLTDEERRLHQALHRNNVDLTLVSPTRD